MQHVEYRHLAECPDGFIREQPYIKRDHGTTLKPNAKSLEFIDSLYEEYLPNFTSNNFNVGMDEPWELGQGWSREEVGKNGKDKVYLRHLDGIRKLVEKHGKRMQFWADVLLEKPENAKLLAPPHLRLSGGMNQATHLMSRRVQLPRAGWISASLRGWAVGALLLADGRLLKKTSPLLTGMLRNMEPLAC